MSLADLLDQATVIYPGTTDGYMRKMDANRGLEALAPDMARLLIDMAAELDEWLRAAPAVGGETPALLARFASLDAKAGGTE